MWPRALLGGPMPRAAAGSRLTTMPGEGATVPTVVGRDGLCLWGTVIFDIGETSVKVRLFVIRVGLMSQCALQGATGMMWTPRGTRTAAACGLPSQGVGARSRRRTDLARRPHGAAVARAGVDGMWPHALLGEPKPWAVAESLTDAGCQGTL